MENYELEHGLFSKRREAGKGEERPGHKYMSRKWDEAKKKWIYFYEANITGEAHQKRADELYKKKERETAVRNNYEKRIRPLARESLTYDRNNPNWGKDQRTYAELAIHNTRKSDEYKDLATKTYKEYIYELNLRDKALIPSAKNFVKKLFG